MTRSSFGAAVLAAATLLAPLGTAQAADGVSTLTLKGEGACELNQYDYGYLTMGDNMLQVPLYPGGASVTAQFPAWFYQEQLTAVPLGDAKMPFSVGNVKLQGCAGTDCDPQGYRPACAGTTYLWDPAAPGTLTFGPPDTQSQTCGCSPGGSVQPR